jgi:hypothetical protein
VAIEDYELFSDELFIRYCRAQAKNSLVKLLSAFDYNLPGGVRVNTQALSAEAQAEMTEVMAMINGENSTSYFLQWS